MRSAARARDSRDRAGGFGEQPSSPVSFINTHTILLTLSLEVLSALEQKDLCVYAGISGEGKEISTTCKSNQKQLG